MKFDYFEFWVHMQNVERQNIEYKNGDNYKTSSLQNVDTTKR
jgi:hypothetical protein